MEVMEYDGVYQPIPHGNRSPLHSYEAMIRFHYRLQMSNTSDISYATFYAHSQSYSVVTLSVISEQKLTLCRHAKTIWG